VLLAALACTAVASCGTGKAATAGSSSSRAALGRYLAQVEPLRLGVNRLLEGADPILSSLHERRIGRTSAALRMERLERHFAEFTVEIAAIDTQPGMLAPLQAEYAQAYVLEDAYLSALVAGIAGGELTDLPNTQAEQRAAIIRWRTGLEVLARKVHLVLPADLQQAGRGEIAPSATGGS
jgi:hypothetical protein